MDNLVTFIIISSFVDLVTIWGLKISLFLFSLNFFKYNKNRKINTIILIVILLYLIFIPSLENVFDFFNHSNFNSTILINNPRVIIYLYWFALSAPALALGIYGMILKRKQNLNKKIKIKKFIVINITLVCLIILFSFLMLDSNHFETDRIGEKNSDAKMQDDFTKYSSIFLINNNVTGKDDIKSLATDLSSYCSDSNNLEKCLRLYHPAGLLNSYWYGDDKTFNNYDTFVQKIKKNVKDNIDSVTQNAWATEYVDEINMNGYTFAATGINNYRKFNIDSQRSIPSKITFNYKDGRYEFYKLDYVRLLSANKTSGTLYRTGDVIFLHDISKNKWYLFDIILIGYWEKKSDNINSGDVFAINDFVNYINKDKNY